MNKNFNILHIVPTSYGGGVETAAKSFLHYSCRKFKFQVFFLKNSRKENTFLSYLNSFLRIKRLHPDIILTSLWKSNLITLIYKSININTKYILFLHSTKNKHFLDGLITSLCALLAHEIWADSHETFLERIDSLYFFKIIKNRIIKKKDKRIISFILEKIKPTIKLKCSPSFIYWGRLCPYKNIDKAINFFSKLYYLNKKATFVIIGPDYGAKKILEKKIRNMNLENIVLIFDYMNFEEIKKYAEESSFFIQLSSYEGMAMSVCESMQLGLIPLVTNVGQIKKYCKNLHNSLIYQNDDNEILGSVIKILNSKKEYVQIRKNIIETWSNHPTYKKDMVKNFDDLITKKI